MLYRSARWIGMASLGGLGVVLSLNLAFSGEPSVGDGMSLPKPPVLLAWQPPPTQPASSTATSSRPT